MSKNHAVVVGISVILVALMYSAIAFGQCEVGWKPGEGLPGVDGIVNALIEWDPDGDGPKQALLVASGDFYNAGGMDVNGIAVWDGNSWQAFGNGVNGSYGWPLTVYNGQLIATGGEYDKQSGLIISYVVRWDGSNWLPIGDSFTGEIYALTVYNGQLIAAGDFGIIHWDGSSWQPLGSGVSGSVRALTIYNGELIAGGGLIIEGVTYTKVARWNGTSWDRLDSDIQDYDYGGVSVLTVYNNELIAGGNFVWETGGETAVSIAGWNGSNWHPLNYGMLSSNTNGWIKTLAVYDGDLIAGGYFDKAGGIDANNIARWDGSKWESLGTGITGDSVDVLTVYKGDLIAGGSFNAAGGVVVSNIAQWDGTHWSPGNDELNKGAINALTTYNGQIIAAGIGADYIAGWDGVAWQPLGSGLDDVVYCLTVYNGELIAGGAFTTYAGDYGETYNHIARWDGTSWKPLGSGMKGGNVLTNVYALTVYNGQLIAGGDFSTAGGISANNIARWDGSVWQPMGDGFFTQVNTLTIYNGELIAGGVGTYRWDGTSWQLLASGLSGVWWGDVYALTVYNGSLIIAGALSYVDLYNNIFINCIAQWDGTNLQSLGNWSDASYTDTIYSLAVYDGDLIAGGDFNKAGDVSANNIARWDGSSWHNMGNGITGGWIWTWWYYSTIVKSLMVYNGELIAGGNFTNAGNGPSVCIARWGSSCFHIDPITLGVPYNGNISTGDSNLFSIQVGPNKNLLITAEPCSPSSVLELYAQFDQVPTRSNSWYATKNKNKSGDYSLLISPTQSGTYYIRVYGQDVNGVSSYKLTVSVVDNYISDVYPKKIMADVHSTVSILGLGLTNGMQVELRNGDGNSISADTVILSSSVLMFANFDLSSAPPGFYDLHFTWPDGNKTTIASAVEVIDIPEGALYTLPGLELGEGETFSHDIQIQNQQNLFVTLQKTSLVNNGDSWPAKLSILYNGTEIAAVTGSHDLILQVKNPEPGLYTIHVKAEKAGKGILTVWASLPELTLGEWTVGRIYCSWGSTWYQVFVPLFQEKLCLYAEALGIHSHFNVYYDHYDSWVHWISDWGSTVYMEIPNPVGGTYIVEFVDPATLYTGDHWSEDQTRDVLIKADTTKTVLPPPVYLPFITSFSPEAGGNTGFVTVEIKGGWLDPNATVSLVRKNFEDISAQTVVGNSEKTILKATFDLIGKAPGDYNLVVTNPDGHKATAPKPFTIEQVAGGGGQGGRNCNPKMSVEIIGKEKIRANTKQSYIIKYSNLDNVDANGVPLWIAGIPRDADLEIDFGIMSLGSSSVPDYMEIDGEVVIPLIVPYVPPGSGGMLRITLIIPSSSSVKSFTLRAWTNPPFFNCLPPAAIKCTGNLIAKETGHLPQDDCVSSVFETLEGLCSPPAVGENEAYSYSGLFGYALVQCSGGPLAGVPEMVKDIIRTGISAGGAVSGCAGTFDRTASAELEVEVVESVDPKDKYGQSGFDMAGTPIGEQQRFVAGGRDFYYKVDFFNKEDATAPAADVLVKDKLDPNLDWSSFRFEDFGFRKWNVKLERTQYFNINVDMRPDVNLIVNVEGKFDNETGEITWVFRSLDPYTLQKPEDPMVGFLPPITSTGEEVGWVEYSVKPKEGLPSGTQIKNQAFVEFDWAGDINNNPAPEEGPWLNTIDSLAPASSVSPLSALTRSPFTVEWTGDDGDGSGVGSYDIYVSTDSSDYVLWLDDANSTSAVFNGPSGHTYAFYSVARDNVGNIETIPILADATTTAISQISVALCTVVAGSKVNSDKISVSGKIDATVNDFNGFTAIEVAIDSNYMNPCVLTFPIDGKTFKKGKYSYSGTENGVKNGIKKSFKYDTKTRKFTFAVSNLSLAGLNCPVFFDISFGNYLGSADVNEAIVNGKSPIPIKLMMGIKDVLRVDKFSLKRGKIKPNTDQLTVKGGFAVDKPKDVNMAAGALDVNLAGQTFTIPAGKLKSNKTKDRFTCSNVLLSDGSICSADFNLKTCAFSLSIKNTKIGSGTGPADLRFEFAGFSEHVNVTLP